ASDRPGHLQPLGGCSGDRAGAHPSGPDGRPPVPPLRCRRPCRAQGLCAQGRAGVGMTAVVSAAIAWRNRQPLPGGIAAMPTRFKSGYGMSGGNGRRLAHRPMEAAIVTDGRSSLMPARWACGADTLDSFALPGLGELQCCRVCRVAERFPRGPMVYRFYDRDDRLIYIGSTICYPQRQRSHEVSTRWWPEVV